jgi:hypothetical protein
MTTGPGRGTSTELKIQILEQDRDVVHMKVVAGDTGFEVMANVVHEEGTLTLREVHVSRTSGSFVSPSIYLRAAREFQRLFSAELLIIHGGVRTSGASPGHQPRPIRLKT